MNVVRIIVAIILTALLLVIARRTSRGHPEDVTLTDNGYTLTMTTVPKGTEMTKARIDVALSGGIISSDMRVVIRNARSDRNENLGILSGYNAVPMILADSTKGTYFTEVSCGERGKEYDYFFEVRDKGDKAVASFAAPEGKPWRLRYFGEVPKFVLLGHIGFIFGSLFFISLAALQGLRLVGGYTNATPMAQLLGLATLAALVGGLPFGIAMNWFALGGLWEGVPFGTDATDNKTQLLIVYLIFATLITLGSLTKGRLGKDLYSSKVLGWFGFGSFLVALGIYLIPHSIQFTASVTYGVCYSFIGLFALVYLVRLLTAKPATQRR